MRNRYLPKRINLKLKNIINQLNDTHSHTGMALAKELKVSRTAIWKMINRLRNYGISITSLKWKGYRLDEPLILLDEKTIQSQLKLVQHSMPKIEVFESIQSTNDYLQQFYGTEKIRICLTEHQSAGRGRRLNRSWYSPFGQNLYLSLLYPFKKDISELSGLSLVVALAICKGIESICSLPAPLFVKWPNDIFFTQDKLGGTLIDIKAQTHEMCEAIIGVGLNINMSVAEGSISHWTSLRKVDQKYYDRNKLASSINNSVLIYLEDFEKKGFSLFLNEWKRRDYLLGKMVKLKSGQSSIQGKVVGISQQGYIKLKLKSGKIITLSAGEVILEVSS